MSSVFLVQHERRIPVPADVKMIGVYSSLALADAAVGRLRMQSGFRDLLDAFTVTEVSLDRDHWPEGYGDANEHGGEGSFRVACAFCTQTVTPVGDDPLEVFVRGALTDGEQGLYAHAECLRAAVHPSVPLLTEPEDHPGESEAPAL
jgi:hypothetical protein